MRQLKLTSNLFLIEHNVKLGITASTKTGQVLANNHVWIFDRSGSMSSTLVGLVDDISQKLTTIPRGDTISIGWFSGEGQCDFIVKGVTINCEADHEKISGILQNYKSTVGTTCFSEILHKLYRSIADLKQLNPTFSLVFFTDGYPVVSDYSKEIKKIAEMISVLQSSLESVMLVGYGAQYNKELLSDMAGQFGGTLVHSSNLQQYSESMTEFLETVKETSGRIQLNDVSSSIENAYVSINGKTVISYSPRAGIINFVVPKTSKSALYTLSPVPILDVEILPAVAGNDVSLLRAAYAMALVLTQKTKTDLALEILGNIGDIALVDAVTNSYTNEEYGKAEALIRAAVATPSGRFTGGKDFNYLPPRNAFCLIDAIDALVEDESVRFYPKDPGFKYNRVGVKYEQKEGTPEFTPEGNPGVPISTLTWNNEVLNLSITSKIPGFVKLDKHAKDLGFTSKYPTFIWRSYSLVKDGNVNVDSVPLSMSLSTFNLLKKYGIVHAFEWKESKAYYADFNAVPVMNRAMADGKNSAKDLASKAVEDLKLRFKLNVLKNFKDRLESTGQKDYSTRPVLTALQEEYLRKFNVGYSGFQPPCEESDPTDYYMAKEFSIKIAKFSSIPKIDDLVEKLKKVADGKGKLTPAEILLESTYNDLRPILGNLSIINSALAELSAKQTQLRKTIQRVKFAILLGKRWFEEFDSREDCSVVVDNFTVTFGVRSVKLPI